MNSNLLLWNRKRYLGSKNCYIREDLPPFHQNQVHENKTKCVCWYFSESQWWLSLVPSLLGSTVSVHRVHKGSQGSTRVHKGLQGSARAHEHPQGPTRIHKGPRVSVRAHEGPQGWGFSRFEDTHLFGGHQTQRSWMWDVIFIQHGNFWDNYTLICLRICYRIWAV